MTAKKKTTKKESKIFTDFKTAMGTDAEITLLVSFPVSKIAVMETLDMTNTEEEFVNEILGATSYDTKFKLHEFNITKEK